MLIKKLDLKNSKAIAICAEMMANSEPWLTLGRDYEASVQTISMPNKEVYLAYKDNEILGFSVLNMQGAFIGYIQTLCISPTQRGKGIGSQLLSFVEDRIFRESPNIFMCVSSFNIGAQKLYQKLGYEVVGELKVYVLKAFGHNLMETFCLT
ncbi:MAG: GNAT family N-acetyltransferase, partial [Anaerolineae bacterium]|nr:GNAT family N-acetyltransferase [Anaerolineae bacterium]